MVTDRAEGVNEYSGKRKLGILSKHTGVVAKHLRNETLRSSMPVRAKVLYDLLALETGGKD